ncbi:unnamed protein product [Symbiodinium sp. CCMP2592]|nr:unnamed protein product [Symbiodinium sp. CCMP2592]
MAVDYIDYTAAFRRQGPLACPTLFQTPHTGVTSQAAAMRQEIEEWQLLPFHRHSLHIRASGDTQRRPQFKTCKESAQNPTLQSISKPATPPSSFRCGQAFRSVLRPPGQS